MTPTTQAGATSADETRTILARLWCRAEGNDPDDTISDAGHTVLDGLLGGLDPKALATIKEAERELRVALASPAVVPESVRQALQFYADDKNYRLGALLDPNGSHFEGGERAQKALVAIAPTLSPPKILEACNTPKMQWALTCQWPDGMETVEIVSDHAARTLGYIPDEE